ncbi:MAG TPA: phytanoyl-CoA dioxygenase family protein [Tepidisphaeraceae bacterium]|jgi:ectoine hydroxylase-related dioxygenase (phytanoyl-CoA dioxygenase family)|nr:phytanoyl-CoA dioxygenase family protein [Tepidisphaeraceae bacterium]
MNATAPDITETLSPDQTERFDRDGYIAIPKLLDPTTLETLRDYYDRIIRSEIKLPGDRQLGSVTRQVMHPRKDIPYFNDNPAVSRGLRLAKQLLRADRVEVSFDMLIYKPPMHPKATPWHQDFAYNNMPFAPEGMPMDGGGVQFWVALDDVDFENGCMHFLPGHHKQALRLHYVYAGKPTDEGRLLATAAFGDPDLPNEGIACPLAAGGCTIHAYGTPHYTPPNTSQSRGRRAYIFNVRAM